MNQNHQTITKFIEQLEDISTEQKTLLLKAVKDADHALTIAEFKLDRTEKVKRTTAILLEETIEELEQKRKAVEMQNRELEIESSLERVRTIAMSMKKRDDMLDVCKNISFQLQSLGVKDIRNVQTAIFYEERGTYMNYEYYAKHDKTFITETVYTNHEIAKAFAEKMLKGKGEVSITLIKGEEKVKEWLAYQKTTNVFIDTFLEIASSLNYYFFSLGPVALGISTYSILSDNELGFFKRFLNVFDLAYRRYLDIEQAEFQAREAQIEAALERIRSRSMAMHKSEELHEAGEVLFLEMQKLGIESLTAGYVLLDEEGKNGLNYAPNPLTKKIFSMPVIIPHNETVHMKRVVENWKKGKLFLIVDLDEAETIKHQTFIAERSANFPLSAAQLIAISPAKLFLHNFYFKEGYVLIVGGNRLSGEQTDIMLRFTKVFQQTYTRFLDLQKAEAQAHESKVELSLERVRAKVTAMRESSELLDIVVTMRNEFVLLNHEAHYFWHMRWLPEKYEKAMTSGDGTRIGMVMTLPRHIHGDIKLVADWEKSDEPSVVLAMDVETAVVYVEKMITLGDFEVVDHNAPTLDDIRHIGGLTFVMARTTHGEIGYSLPGVVPEPPVEDIATLVRFAGVFDLAYKRFEDLQTAERQHREARIELALERVRSRTMAMAHSNELAQTVAVMFEQFMALGEEPERMAIEIVNEKEHVFDIWATQHGGSQLSELVQISLDEPHVMKKMYKAWKEKTKSITIDLHGNELEEYFQFLKKAKLPVQRKIFGKRRVQNVATFSKGILTIITPEPRPQETIQLLERFAAAFDGTYTRFFDLQKAEAQSREAQIEASLERVRSRTMGMYRSDELQEAAGVLFQQVGALGVPVFGTGFNIWDTDRKFATAWMGGKDRMQPPFKTSSSEDIYALIFEAAQKGVSLFVKEQGGEALKTHYKYLNSIPVFKEIADKMAMAGQSFPTFQIMHCAFFSHGYLMFISFDPVPDAYDIFKRFAKVFEQTYTRFLDLQKAETQAIEATKRASVDRVRAEIASMRTTKDLERITPLIWNELTTLGVPFIRSGVFIMDEEHQQVQVHLSTPAGKAIAAFHLNYQASVQSRQIVSHWREMKVFKDHMDEAAFAEYTKNLVQQGALASDEKYVTESHPTDLYLHFLPFPQGMLYVGNDAPLKEEELRLVQDLADAFSTAYARYEDFNKLEAAKLQVDNALVNLKQAQQQLVQSEKMASLGELTAGIAHEIQNPLNFVNNFSEVSSELVDEIKVTRAKNQETRPRTEEDEIEDEILEDIKQNLEKINHHGKRASGIVKGMLEHSRTSSGQKELTDLNALADEYLRLAYHGLKAKDKSFNAKMKTDFDPALPKIEVVPQDIGRVILNLITNAFYAVNASLPARAGKDGIESLGKEKAKQGIAGFEPTVSVTTRKEGNKVLVSVKDNGNGIPEHIKEKIFQPFFTTKPTGQGTGLGLSLSYDIMKAHGGEIKLNTKIDQGTEFTITLPA